MLESFYCKVAAWNSLLKEAKVKLIDHLYQKKTPTQRHLHKQGRSQNLQEVPQNFMEVFNIDDVRDNYVIQKNQHR